MDPETIIARQNEELIELRRRLRRGDSEAMPQGMTNTPGMCSREMTAREILEAYRERLVERLEGIDALLKALPSELPGRADKALRFLINTKE